MSEVTKGNGGITMSIKCDKCGHIMTDKEHEDYPQCPMCWGAYCTKIPNQKCNCDCCKDKIK